MKIKATGDKEKSGSDATTLRVWQKRLKRTQRRKKTIELESIRMKDKKAKKKKGEEGKEAVKSGETAA
ncbi:MAG: hypothetical protein HYR80_01955 [Nitrospirae bacterium]|nr:hypothetical protein [Nitrospirota bacterium]